MNKKLITIAVATAMAMPMVVNAGTKAKFYGRMHVAGEMVDDGTTTTYSLNGHARKANRIGGKAEFDTNLMDFKGVAQIEIGLNQENNVTGKPPAEFFQRDSWVGLSSKSVGTVRMGTIVSSWKQTGKSVDPLFTTALEGRGFLRTQSAQLVAGTGLGRGRSTHTVRYDSPNMGGAKVVLDYNFNPTGADNIGLGVRWKGGPAAVFFDYKSIGEGNYVDGGANSGTAMKFGGKYRMGDIAVMGEYSIDGGAISKTKDGTQNLLHLSGVYSMGATAVVVTFGMAAESTDGAKNGNTAFGLAVKQKLAKGFAAYVGYGLASGEDNYNGGNDMSAAAAGLIATF